MTIGERVRSLRKKQGLSISALARKAEMTDGALNQIESGTTRSPSFENGLKLATALGVSPDELAFGERRDTKTRPQDLPIVVAELERQVADLQRRVSSLEQPRRRRSR